ncbi:MAG TPA: Gfo/Idh/MocA family oxidoreductase, partial [Chthonomonadales bacterium]|nr:Gfo/Idh/MocA family oxidoreductase [Chthonomonadales bacterium]
QTVIPQRRDRETGAMRAVEVDDIAVAQCELQGGALGTLEASRVSTGTQDELRLELHGSGGGLRFNLMDPNWLEAYDARPAEAAYGGDRGYRRIEAATRYGPPYSLGATKNTVGWMSFHIHSLFNFLGNVSAKLDGGQTSPLSPTFADGLAVQRVISAWIESASVGRSVSIDWP